VLHGDHDVAFVDIGLPKLSGYEVAQAIRSRPEGARIVLIALSGYGQPEDKRMAIEAGFDDHLTKPVKATTLTQLLNELEKYNR
jgi:CheY-like chemotaxis protein